MSLITNQFVTYSQIKITNQTTNEIIYFATSIWKQVKKVFKNMPFGTNSLTCRRVARILLTSYRGYPWVPWVLPYPSSVRPLEIFFSLVAWNGIHWFIFLLLECIRIRRSLFSDLTGGGGGGGGHSPLSSPLATPSLRPTWLQVQV